MGGSMLSRAGLALLAAGAFATGAAGQGIVPSDVERGITVTTRPRPDFDPIGVRLGGFRLNASAEGGLGWDSNVFGRGSNRVSDGFVAEGANVSLNSDWTTHALGLSGSMTAQQSAVPSSTSPTGIWEGSAATTSRPTRMSRGAIATIART